ncbi:MAG: anthranilate synthase component II [Candidatus Binatia bacterium]
MILLIDNYDSFTYNLYQYLSELGTKVQVSRNDKISLEKIEELQPDKIVISPGPCTPNEAGISCDVIRSFGAKIPILGVCLGHQCIGAAFGGEIARAPTIMHGKLSDINHDSKTIYRSLANPFSGMRYHSLILNPNRLPSELSVSSVTSDNIIMGVRHRSLPVEGVQFHPESILTQVGKKLLENFLTYY